MNYFHRFFLLFFIYNAHAMKQCIEIQKKPEHPFFKIPTELIYYIIMPCATNWQCSTYSLKNIAEIASYLQSTCKHFALLISPEQIANFLNINDTNKNLFLIKSAQIGIPCFVQHAISIKSNLNCFYNNNKDTKYYGSTPLSIATRCNNFKCCLYLLQAKANPNQTEQDLNQNYLLMTIHKNNYVPLHHAAIQNNCSIIQLLITYKADIKIKSVSGYTPLTLALSYSNIKAIECLINNGETVSPFFEKRYKQLLSQNNPPSIQ